MPQIFINNNFYEEDKAVISIKDRALRLGDGIFETISFYSRKLYRWDLHSERLEGGLKALKIKCDTSNLQDNILKTIKKNNLQTGLVRLEITRGEGSHGYLPTGQKPANIIIEAMERPQTDRKTGSLCVSTHRKTPLASMPVNYKLVSGLNSILARMEAAEKGFFDALMLGTEKQVCECSSGNIFWVKNGIIYTPSLECGVLDGVMRKVVIEASPHKIIQGIYKLDDLKSADEIFFTNIMWGVLPVDKLEDQNFSAGKITTDISGIIQKSI